MSILGNLYDATVETIARPLAYSLKKGGASYPKFRQTIVKMGQRYHDAAVGEEKAIETAANDLSHCVMLCAAWAAVYYEMDRYFDRRMQRALAVNQELKQLHQKALRIFEEKDQVYDKVMQEIFSPALSGGNASQTADGAKD
ncbi:uncharacterized protein LOC107877402 [Capsicum annuum]|uniref:uncharacterized protein LOC107877402 n=1 Tax=Capsicum annuum TaxID=4072 RepID=UPI001FB13ED8|nr:uncharacterized protein LOC107877402 [Capsicum annuum]